MIRDHRPYVVKKAYRRFERFYVDHFLRPQFTSLGPGSMFMKPWRVELFGRPIEVGKSINVIATPDMKVRLSVWSHRPDQGRIRIGDYCLICPGVRIGSALDIKIGDNCMLAHGAYITDSDWHDLYNRIAPCDRCAPVVIDDNVWVGDSAIICKGVHVGRNSVVGAGAVVVGDVPENTVVAGNPARVVKELDREVKMTTRADWFANPVKLSRDIEQLDRMMLRGNSFRGWLRSLLFPARGD